VIAPIWNLSDYLRFIHHNNPLVRSWALDNIQAHYPCEAIEEVAVLMNDSDSEIALKAVEYLGQSGSASAGRALLTKLKEAPPA